LSRETLSFVFSSLAALSSAAIPFTISLPSPIVGLGAGLVIAAGVGCGLGSFFPKGQA
jgi:hypothetical protein